MHRRDSAAQTITLNGHARRTDNRNLTTAGWDWPQKRPRFRPISYYLASLLHWHDETLNCWTNIAAIVAVSCIFIFTRPDPWTSYQLATSVITNLFSLASHLLISANYRTECTVFAFDLYGCMIQGANTCLAFAMHCSGSDPEALLTFDKTAVAVKVLSVFCLLLSLDNYRSECRIRADVLRQLTHVDVMSSLKPAVACMAGLMAYFLLLYRHWAVGLTIATCLLCTRGLLQLCNIHPGARWLLHAVSHVTGGIAVSCLSNLLASSPSSRTLLPTLVRSGGLWYLVVLDGVGLLATAVTAANLYSITLRHCETRHKDQ